jgi:hypothetical protein
MTPAQIFRLTLWECAYHATIGWLAGSLMTVCLALTSRLAGGFPAPSLEDLLWTLAIGLPFCVGAVIIPSLVGYIRRSSSDALMRQAG